MIKMNLQMQHVDEIKALLNKIEKDLTANAANARVIKASLLAMEDMLLVLFDEPDFKILNCNVIRNTKELAIEVICNGAEAATSKLNEPDTAFILNRICKRMGYRLSVDCVDNNTRIRFLLEQYHQFIDNILFVFKFLGKDRKVLYKGTFFHIFSILINLLIPYLTGKMIVSYTENVFVQIIVTAVSIFVVRLIYAYTFHSASIYYSDVSLNLKKYFYTTTIDEFFKIKDEIIEKSGSGTFLRRVMEDTDVIANGPCQISDMSSDAIYFAGVMIASFAISPVVFFAELGLFFILLMLERKRGYYLELDMRKANMAGDASSGTTLDLINGVQEVKLLNGKQALTNRLDESTEEYKKLSLQATVRSERHMTLNETFTAFGYMMIMVYFGYSLNNHTMTIPDALILFNYYSIIGTPLVGLVQGFMDFKKSFCLSCERIRNVIEGYEFPKEENGTLRLGKVKGDFCLKDVSFAYYHDDPLVKDVEVFRKINLEIQAGSTVAFVGKSGCGKTTLLKMLAGQRVATNGTITIDGNNYKDLDKITLYDNVSVINQSPHIFNMTIKENMLCAKSDATMEKIEAACKKALILDDINALESGFDTELGENGVILSGGQCQRLALARAFLRNTPVLILDEATSALDNITQEAIMNSIDSMKSKHTVIIVAHRLSTIQNADKIFIIADKGIKDSGTHAELLARCKEYRELYQSEENG